MTRAPSFWDALHAADLIVRFVDGRSFTEYQADDLVRSAVERQFEIIGEALNQSTGLRAVLNDLVAS